MALLREVATLPQDAKQHMNVAAADGKGAFKRQPRSRSEIRKVHTYIEDLRTLQTLIL